MSVVQPIPLGETDQDPRKFEQIIGNSSALESVLEQVECVAPTDSTALILGETGTGKELIARAIHNLSTRCGRPFVKLNCAAIPFELLESELFGHERGAFTGAIAQKRGRFELAHTGTLFLDEIGDIPLASQPKLLRVLQEHEFERLGSAHTVRVDVRVIAATHRDLGQMVTRNDFRSDLYYRLNVFPITLPPLRERREDIIPLVLHFVEIFSRRMGKTIHYVSPVTLAAFKSYDWPGNIRELQNVVERAIILSEDGTLPDLLTPETVKPPTLSSAQPTLKDSEQDLPNLPTPETVKPLTPSSAQPTLKDIERDLKDFERALILRTLQGADWVIGGTCGAAAKLGVKRTTLIAKMKKLGITRSRNSSGVTEPLDDDLPATRPVRNAGSSSTWLPPK